MLVIDTIGWYCREKHLTQFQLLMTHHQYTAKYKVAIPDYVLNDICSYNQISASNILYSTLNLFNLESHAVSYHDLLNIHKTLLMVPDLPSHGMVVVARRHKEVPSSSVLSSIYESTLLLCYYNIMHIMDDYHLPFQLSKP